MESGKFTTEKDSLLRRCIEIHGEGKWHLVSKRAGLNRCRKSCRLRWVNYLDPNVNREKFEEDEIDLIIRMHRLLGNKWSLIAGRIPGRTANDIKNYFNTHLRKMLESQPKEEEEEPERHRVVRPIPRYPTTVIGTGGPPVVSENQRHQLHHNPPPQLPLPEQNEDPVIENNEHTTWRNDTFKFLELEGVDKMNENPAVPNVGESSQMRALEWKEWSTQFFKTAQSTGVIFLSWPIII